jgi:hypothetical protein
MSEEARHTEGEQQEHPAKAPRQSEPQGRRPWHPPAFSTLEVAATEQQTPDGRGHCWGSWKCS